MPGQPKIAGSALNSWKEISVYLGRGVRTVQRWERELGLPIHRVRKGPRSPVHAFPSELKTWLARIDRQHGNRDGRDPLLHRQEAHGLGAASRVLVERSTDLVQQMMDSLWLQRQRTEVLIGTLAKMRSQMREQVRQQRGELEKLRKRMRNRGSLDGRRSRRPG